MLDTIHSREHYLSKSAEYAGLARVLSGETTIQNTLEACLARTDEPDLDTHHILHFLSESEGIEYDGLPCFTKKELNYRWGGMLAFGSLATLGALAISALTISVMTPLVIPSFLAAAGIGVSGSAGIAQATNYITIKLVERERKTMLTPLCEAAEELDADIGRHFIYEHFIGAPERFECTYRSLPDSEKDTVDNELFRMLESGILETDESGLSKRLYALREPGE